MKQNCHQKKKKTFISCDALSFIHSIYISGTYQALLQVSVPVYSQTKISVLRGVYILCAGREEGCQKVKKKS